MRNHRVVISPHAAKNIRIAFEWLASENPAHAINWRDGLRTAILGLETLPDRNPVAPESNEFDVEVRHLI
jgi:plasmid stabilization system protein ParE